jgi:hypothetical protein
MSGIGASVSGSRRNADSGGGEGVPTNPFLSFLPFLYFLNVYSALQ